MCIYIMQYTAPKTVEIEETHATSAYAQRVLLYVI